METNTFSHAHNLGALVAEYPVNPKAQREALLAGWGFIAIGGVFALIGLAVSKGKWPDLLIAAVGIPLALIGVLAFVKRRRRQDFCIRIFTDGFTHTLNGQTVAVRWDEVTEVWQNVIQTYRGSARSRRIHIYTVRLANGRKFVFDDQIDKIMGLGATLQQQCAARILARADAPYHAGESIAFGPFRVSRDGITKGNTTLSWNQVERVELRKGMLHIRKKEQRRDWAFAMASRIPNLPVLMALASHNIPGQ